jgi:PBP1b-binding outer membrane lipoprotein LpoB
MKQLLLLTAIAVLLGACSTPATPATSQPAAGQSFPEVTVFRSPT